ncbi:MAG: biotin transporter BioY [Bacteroidota bacterium]|nr:biotin transporter BioY [Bacteroidota bacterium]
MKSVLAALPSTFPFPQTITERYAGVVGFALITSAAAQISIPLQPVPLTLQTIAVFLSGALLGPKRGALTQSVYLFAGAVGLPVFAGFSGTLGHLMGPTGGYLLAFPFAAWVTGVMGNTLRRFPPFVAFFVAMTIANLAVFFLGVSWLSLFWLHDWSLAWTLGFANILVWDIPKLAVAAGIAASIGKKTISH